MEERDKQLARHAARATIYSLPFTMIGVVLNGIGLWVMLHPPAPPSKPAEPPRASSRPVGMNPVLPRPGDQVLIDPRESDPSSYTPEYLGLKRFWGDDFLGRTMEWFFSKPFVWVPISLAFIASPWFVDRLTPRKAPAGAK
jgi:hypothetical protein